MKENLKRRKAQARGREGEGEASRTDEPGGGLARKADDPARTG